ncbi:MAG TPA: hypothetical protein VFZ73_15115 [Gemmatimonadaceae bacterium]
MSFAPQSIRWPGTRAVLLVHGIGNASVGLAGSFPLDALKRVLADEEPNVAVYNINYDFINDWVATKVNFQAGITALKSALKVSLGNDAADGAIAEAIGDVLWPVLSPDLRLAVRDAIIAQLDQIQLDRAESALDRGHDPLDYQVSIIAHSLGCFHTYEVLAAIASEPAHQLRPASDLVTFDSVMLMASPVQLIRTVANGIAAIVPDLGTLATLARPLCIPSETRRGRVVRCTEDFISITGSHDPVGGHLLGVKLDWAYMDIPGQISTIVPQQALTISTKDQTALALAGAITSGGAQLKDPHAWGAYIDSQARQMRGVLLT